MFELVWLVWEHYKDKSDLIAIYKTRAGAEACCKDGKREHPKSRFDFETMEVRD